MIKNKTKNTIISKSEEYCDSLLKKATGLMFSTPKDLVFPFNKEEKVTFHMFFVFYSIDIIFLNEKKEVVELKENFSPFSTYSTRKRIKYALELPINTIKKTRTRVGDEIIL